MPISFFEYMKDNPYGSYPTRPSMELWGKPEDDKKQNQKWRDLFQDKRSSACM